MRAKVKELVNRIKEFTNNNNEKVFLYEIIVSELVAHKGADINQMTQQSGNPDIQAQCNHHDMLKSNELTMALAQCFVQNQQLWKEVRNAYLSETFPQNSKVISNFSSTMQSDCYSVGKRFPITLSRAISSSFSRTLHGSGAQIAARDKINELTTTISHSFSNRCLLAISSIRLVFVLRFCMV